MGKSHCLKNYFAPSNQKEKRGEVKKEDQSTRKRSNDRNDGIYGLRHEENDPYYNILK